MVQGAPSATPALAAEGSAAPVTVAKRDWVAWYEDLDERERREIRDRLLTMTPDDVREDAEARTFFFFHVDDLVEEAPPGTRRLTELHNIVSTLRGREGSADDRRKAVHFMLAEYQAYLRDNPFVA
ncbi:MAG TPA: hypothetical protein VM889_10790 [Candidatus Thermoplasmatota archaeon]|nr:hypothetical protein [Candidatus Thermoplasmatota archaeon]